MKKSYFHQVEKIIHSILSNYEAACLKPYSATMLKISTTIIVKTQRITDGLDYMFKGLVADIRTDFQHGSTLVSIIQHAP